MLNDVFRDMLSALSAEGADFLLVGAYAMAVHGLSRATKRATGRPEDLADVAWLETER